MVLLAKKPAVRSIVFEHKIGIFVRFGGATAGAMAGSNGSNGNNGSNGGDGREQRELREQR